MKRSGLFLVAALLAPALWAQDAPYAPYTYVNEEPTGPHPFLDCTQFDGMDFWIWSDYTYVEKGTVWPDPAYKDGRPTQLAFQGSIHDPQLWVPRDPQCHVPPFECQPDKVLRGMKLKLLPPYEVWWETWGNWIDAGPDWGWVPSWISAGGVFFVANTPDLPSGKLNIRYEGSYLRGINDSAPGIDPPKYAPDWGIEWVSPGFMPPFINGEFANEEDLHAICDAILHGNDG